MKHILFFLLCSVLFTKSINAQTATTGDYRSAVTTGNWSTLSSWQVRDVSGNWTTPAVVPSATNNVYIQIGHTINVDVATADCKDLQLQAAGILSIGTNTLQVSGKIRSYNSIPLTSSAVSSNVATIVTTAAHGYTVGQSVIITGLAGSPMSSLNGTYTIASVPTTTSFTFSTTGVADFATTTSGVTSAAVSKSGTAIVGATDGVFYSGQFNSSSVNSTMCTTTSGTGSLKFIGTTRNIAVVGEWTSNSVFFASDVNFALTAANTGTITSTFGGRTITFSSGTITTSRSLTANNSSTNSGSATIKTGATLMSSTSQVLGRTSSAVCASFTIETGATLQVSNSTPTLDALAITNNGTVIYAGSAQTLLGPTSGVTGGVAFTNYNVLRLQGSGNKTIPANTAVTIANNGFIILGGSSTSTYLVLGAGSSLTYGTNGTLQLAGTQSVVLPANPVEWPVTNGPTNVTVNANILSFVANSNTNRIVPGTLTLNGGSFQVNATNTLTMGDNSTIIRDGAANNLSLNSGNVAFGTTAAGLVNVNINVTCSNTSEILSTQAPGKVGTLTVASGATYTFTGGRAVTNLVNNGVITLTPATTFTFAISGNITGTGTITGNTNASISFGGSTGTLSFTTGSQVARGIVFNGSGILTLGTPVVISTNLDLSTGTLAAGVNNVTVNGNVTGTGSFTGSGKIIMSGGAVPSLISGATISNLEINNGFSDTLTGSTTITGTLTLTSGKIVIKPSYTLQVASGNAIAGGSFSSSKCIITQTTGVDETKGVLKISGFSGSRIFPVSDGTNYFPATINPTSNTDFAVTALQGVTNDATITGTALSANTKKDIVDAQWLINTPSTTGNTTVTLAWPGSLEGSNFAAFTNAQVGMSEYDSAINLWSYSTGTGDNTGNTVSRTFTSFTASDFALAVGKVGQRLTGPASILPGEIIINQFNPAYAAGSDNAYIELVNTTNKTFNLANLRLAYQDAAGNDGVAGGNLAGTLLPYSFFLLSPNTKVTVGNTELFRDCGIKGGFGSSGQLSLIEINDLSNVDRLGYGTITGGTYYETTPATAPTAFGGLKRNTDGVDNNNNSTDYSLVSNANIDLRGGNSRLAKTGVSLPAGTYTDISVTGNSSLAGAVGLTGKINVKSGATFTTNNNLTLKSNINRTASVGQSAGTITGNVTVERYIPAYGHRAWRMLSIPTAGSQTIKQAWQENQAPMANGVAGYGTLITSPAGTAGGFDATTQGSSMLVFNQGNPGSWTGVSSTTTAISSNEAYMLFMRGDRSSVIFGGPVSQNATTLRTTGTLYQGTRTVKNIPANTNVLLGNVYASAIDFTALTKTNITSFKVWDPKLAGTSGIGAYQTFSASNNYDPVPGGGSYGNTANTRIESGQAFIVNGETTGGSIQFTEAAKVTGSRNIVFRPIAVKQLKINLYSVVGDNNSLVDGTSVVFDAAYSNEVDLNDASKINNISENISVKRDGKTLAVEARSNLKDEDIISYNISNLRTGRYKLEIRPLNLSDANVITYLEDQFLGTKEPITLTELSSVNFSVTADPKSYAKDRFKMVFAKKAMPVTSSATKASEVDIQVYPNPVVNRKINIHAVEQKKGMYLITIVNQDGKTVYHTYVDHEGGLMTKAITLPATISAGSYEIKIEGGDNKGSVRSIVVPN